MLRPPSPRGLQCALGRSLRLVVGAAAGRAEVLGERVELLAAADGRRGRRGARGGGLDAIVQLAPRAHNGLHEPGSPADTSPALSAALASAATHQRRPRRQQRDAHWPSVRRLKVEQQRAVDAVLGGRDSLVVLSTGFGKSLCFQLPAAARPGLTIVLTPLIALADDQIGDLEARDVSVARWDSSVSREDKDRRCASSLPEDGDDADAVPRLLYCTPEALVHADERHPAAACARGLVGRGLVNAIVVDECHCVRSGATTSATPTPRSARPVVGWLRGVPVQALTATATPRVRDDVSKSPADGAHSGHRDGRPPQHLLEVVDGDVIGDAEAELADLYEWITDNDGAGLVYACKREEVERIAAEFPTRASTSRRTMRGGGRARARRGRIRERRRAARRGGDDRVRYGHQ